jgi:hypothetical protein
VCAEAFLPLAGSVFQVDYISIVAWVEINNFN